MADAEHIIVCDDEAEIRTMVAEYLATQGYAVSPADGGGELRAVLARRAAHLVVLDVRMPGEDGLSLARWLRANHSLGIIMLTAAGETVDRIVGLEMGADDYLPKPFDPRELLARVRSVLRRIAVGQATPAADTAAAPHKVRFGRCVLNLSAHTLHTLEGEAIPLTSMEYDLLQAFARHPNRVLTRDQLLDLAHNREWSPFDRSIDIRIARLRRKVEADPEKPEAIKTIRGAGYMFVSGR